jgi:hypothetical protein
MKLLRLAIAAAFLLGFSSAYAFHSGGVAECGGCHAMHKADSSGAIVGATNTYLLNGTNVNSTCASTSCHAAPGQSSYHIMSYPLPAAGVAPYNRTPGGDFAWLSKTYSYAVRGATTTYSPGGHGLNIPDLGVDTSGTGNSPGGSFPAASLSCASCHDPHGKARTDASGNLVPQNAYKIIGSGSYSTLPAPAVGEAAISAYGTYRLLYTNNSYYTTNYSGPVPATIASGTVTFSTAPLAVAPSTYNQGENVNQVIVRYGAQAGRTFGLWCASCHANMHTNSGKVVHPIDAAMGASGETGYYNAYVNSGNHQGAAGSSYLTLVPFASDGAATRASLAAGATNNLPTGAGPDANSQVMCLSCHRAHASGFQGDIRWEYEGEFLTYVQTNTNVAVWPGTDTTPQAPQFARGKTAAETQAAYYDRPVTQFGAYQRSLCNKCHAQD